VVALLAPRRADTHKQDFVYGQGIDEIVMLEQADVLDHDDDENTSELTRSFYHRNALGSVVEVTDAIEATVCSYRYDPYGAVTITVGGTPQGSDPLAQHWTFTGRFLDEETGFYHYRARAYDPATGRFLQRDPLGYEAGPSLLEYARSCPLSLTDPLGLEPEDTTAAWNAAARAADAEYEAMLALYAAHARVQDLVNRLVFWTGQFNEHKQREPRSGMTPCERWKRWQRELNSPEFKVDKAAEHLHRAESARDAARGALAAATANADAAYLAYHALLARDLADDSGEPGWAARMTQASMDFIRGGYDTATFGATASAREAISGDAGSVIYEDAHTAGGVATMAIPGVGVASASRNLLYRGAHLLFHRGGAGKAGLLNGRIQFRHFGHHFRMGYSWHKGPVFRIAMGSPRAPGRLARPTTHFDLIRK
jgi:RHS repeat-associated protein